MKNIYYLLFFCAFAFSVKAQQGSCYTDQAFRKNLEKKPSITNFLAAEKAAAKWLQENKTQNRGQALIVKIPVVVHVVYKTAAQNVADSNIISQIAVLNECFRKLNPNYVNTRPIFDSLGADVELEFCLADKDPQGNPTTGIIRKSAPSTAAFDPLNGFDAVKSPALGGDTLWPASQYLNIWTCDMSLFSFEIVLGYAQFPGMDPQTDGVVIQYSYFGKNAKPNFLGRTTVHEVGHWLGMRHIWADEQPGNCDSTDFVDDTPNAKGQSQSDCNLTKNTCSVEAAYWGTIDPQDMVENYMDYSKDNCMTMFTKGQKARMYSFLNTNPDRLAITTSTAGCNTYAGVNEIRDFGNYVGVFPNPASNFVKISLNTMVQADFSFECYNSVGQLMKRGEINYLTTEVRTEELPSGIYFFKVFNGANTVTKRVVIDK